MLYEVITVLLPHRTPQDLVPFRRFFRAPLGFNADQCAVVFPTHWLDHRIPGADALLYRHLEKEAAGLHELREAVITSYSIHYTKLYDGYEDASFFRRLFKRRTGLTPSQYRRMFQPVLGASGKM